MNTPRLGLDRRSLGALFRTYANADYLAEERRIDAIRVRILAFYASAIYGGFWALDWIVYPDRAIVFGWLRACVVAAALALAVVTTARPVAWQARAARAIGMAAPAVIAAMCSLTDGFASAYMVGIIICFIAVTTLELYRPADLGLSLGLVIVFYVTVNAYTHPRTPVPTAVSSTSFLAGSLFFCLIASMLLEFQRRSLFQARLSLDARNRDLDAAIRTLRDTQTRLVETEKLSALGRLIASLSHEINNPVNVLRNNLGPLRAHLEKMTAVLLMARRGEAVEPAWVENDVDFVLEDAMDATETMAQGLDRIQAVHREMRAFVRGDAPEMQAGDVGEGLRATVNMFRRSLPREIAIDVQCEDLPPAVFQPGQLNQVFFNLIQNAVDAIEGAGRAGTIGVRAQVDAGWIQVTVEDTGPGVSPWARAHLFEPFFTTKPSGKGTGLGLAIAYQVVERHRGRIELDETHGRGARFVVCLPAA